MPKPRTVQLEEKRVAITSEILFSEAVRGVFAGRNGRKSDCREGGGERNERRWFRTRSARSGR